MKRFWDLFSVVVVLFVAVPLAPAGQEVVDRIVAVVNDDIIRLKQLDKELAPLKKQLASKAMSEEDMRKQLYEARMQLLNDLIDETLADQQIAEAGIQVAEAEVEATIEQVKARNYYTDEDLRQALQMQGLSMEEYRSELKRQILRSRLVNRKIKSSIVITQEDIRRYYEAHPEKYGGVVKYRLRNILVAGPDGNKEAAEIADRIKEIRERISGGTPFGELAQQFSQAPNARDGGVLGEFAIDDLARELRPVIRGMEQGDVSDAVETRQGVQVFYVEQIVQTPAKPLDSVAGEIEEMLYNEQVDEKYDTWLQSLRENAHIRVFR